MAALYSALVLKLSRLPPSRLPSHIHSAPWKLVLRQVVLITRLHDFLILPGKGDMGSITHSGNRWYIWTRRCVIKSMMWKSHRTLVVSFHIQNILLMEHSFFDVVLLLAEITYSFLIFYFWWNDNTFIFDIFCVCRMLTNSFSMLFPPPPLILAGIKYVHITSSSSLMSWYNRLILNVIIWWNNKMLLY